VKTINNFLDRYGESKYSSLSRGLKSLVNTGKILEEMELNSQLFSELFDE
jgi:hypothetical protein